MYKNNTKSQTECMLSHHHSVLSYELCIHQTFFLRVESEIGSKAPTFFIDRGTCVHVYHMRESSD